MEAKKKSSTSFIIAVVLILGAIFTFLPIELADDKCFFGYSATCPFTPISSIVLLAIAGYIFFVRNKQLTTK